MDNAELVMRQPLVGCHTTQPMSNALRDNSSNKKWYEAIGDPPASAMQSFASIEVIPDYRQDLFQNNSTIPQNYNDGHTCNLEIP